MDDYVFAFRRPGSTANSQPPALWFGKYKSFYGCWYSNRLKDSLRRPVMGMEFNVNIKRKIKVNGKEYDSLEEVPEQFRQTVQHALDSAGAPGVHRKITVNGVGYDSVEAMPPDARRLYEDALKKADETGPRSSADAPSPIPNAPVQERALSKRTIIVLVLLAGLAILLKFFAK